MSRKSQSAALTNANAGPTAMKTLDLRKDTTRRLIDACDALTTPTVHTDANGQPATVPPLIPTIRDAMTGTHNSNRTTGRPSSRPPLWTPALDWITHATTLLTTLHRRHPTSRAATLEDMCTSIAVHHYAPTDTEWVADAATALEQLAADGQHLTTPPLFTIDAPCPQCGVRRTDNNVPPLQVHPTYAHCTECGTTWQGENIVDLADTVNPPPE